MSPAPHRSADGIAPSAPVRRSRRTLILLLACAGILLAGLLGLGTWQLKRLQWKLDLIERVQQRVHAAPVAAPDPAHWSQISAANDEYRRVRVSGVFLDALSTKVQAVTDLGSGFWLMTPLRSADGSITLINRGYIPAGAAAEVSAAPAGITSVSGLLRMSEPGGGFLRHNDAAGNRWFSRDAAAIAAAHGLQQVAPYFIDAAASAPVAGDNAQIRYPAGGLTVISFHNNHLVYALTWYALALMLTGAACWLVREDRKQRQPLSEGKGAAAGPGD
ncbi:SURF1 family protein [Herbaspirillum autotrophicum]|uniref:SURF1 family protein n=1 Tax=Herbaspirillum autotrophicum TaxID=180195 RepID=UPI00067A7557|nr:SURF1 family protein [Herbaspirillum autotrophicum]